MQKSDKTSCKMTLLRFPDNFTCGFTDYLINAPVRRDSETSIITFSFIA